MIVIKAETINFAWYSLLRKIKEYGVITPIDKGSYEQIDFRLQSESTVIEITNPQFDMIPIMPAGSEGIAPTTMEYVESYFVNYLLNNELAENEQYTYGERITKQIDEVINKLSKYRYNNQMSISISQPDDIYKNDPPCLREIDFKVVNNKLNMHVYFRSWELWAGLPTNLAGLELLRQYICEISENYDVKMEGGKIFAYSSGLHIYGENWKNVLAFLGGRGR